MNSGNRQTPTLELWLQDVQSYLFKVLNAPMKQAGFEFRKSSFSFQRKNKKNQDILSIIFLSQFPVSYRVGFQFEIWNPQIKEIKKSFMGEIIHKDSDLCSIILFTKDFTSKDPETRTAKDFLIYNYRDLFIAGDWLVQTLQDELIPIYDTLDSIENMDHFFESNPEWSLNSHSGGNICTDLIVGKLIGKRDIHTRFQQLMQGLQQKIENRLISPESRQLLTLCYETIK